MWRQADCGCCTGNSCISAKRLMGQKRKPPPAIRGKCQRSASGIAAAYRCRAVVMAYEMGLFAERGLDVRILVEPSWANVADNSTLAIWMRRSCCRPWLWRWHSD